MKKNFTKWIIALVLIIIIILFSIYVVNLKKGCVCQEISNTVTDKGKIIKTTSLTNENIPSIKLIVSGNNTMVVDNKTFDNLKLNDYKIITSIDNKRSENEWIGLKLTDFLTSLKESFNKRIVIQSENLIILKEYSSIDNLYLFIKKDSKNIFQDEKPILIIANIKEDSNEWFYNPYLINLK
jgi:hypothetical protein